jgi:hypothetical protein
MWVVLGKNIFKNCQQLQRIIIKIVFGWADLVHFRFAERNISMSETKGIHGGTVTVKHREFRCSVTANGRANDGQKDN